MAIATATSLTVDRAAGDERTCTKTPIGWLHDRSRPAVVFCHGRDGSALRPTEFTDTFGTLEGIVRGGYPMVASDLGGRRNWGNDLAIGRVGDARAFAQRAPLLASTGKVLVLGESMGCLAACSWAARNPSLVQALVLMVPAVDLAFHHDNDTLGQAATEIDEAYGGHDAYVAALPTHSPVAYAAESLVGRFPIHVHYGDDDDLAPYEESIAPFVAAAGATTFAKDGGGHDLQGIDADAILALFDATS